MIPVVDLKAEFAKLTMLKGRTPTSILATRPSAAAIAPGPLCGIEPSPVAQAADQRHVRAATGLVEATSTVEPRTSAEFLSVGWTEAAQLTADRHRLIHCG